MAVKLRLKRMGAKKRPSYRIVAADSRSPRDGRFIETVGFYNPLVNPAEIRVDEELAMKWLNNGAIPTDTVRNLFNKTGLNKKFHEAKAPKKTVKKETVKKAVAPKKETAKKSAAKKTTTKKTVKGE